MKIYIASSWKNQHAVEMMTDLLRRNGHLVFSFVENNNGEYDKGMPFEKWIHSEAAEQSFKYDTMAAMQSDLVIYIGPSGKDAAAECAMAYAKKVPLIGLWAKGEDFGLMRKMFNCWCNDYKEVLLNVDQFSKYLTDRDATART